MSGLTGIAIDGGGPFGYAYIGALLALGDLSTLRNLLGISIGSIITTLLAIGYTAQEIGDIADQCNMYSKGRPRLRDLLNFKKRGGVLSNNIVPDTLAPYIARKCSSRDATFGEIYQRYGRNLVIVATNIRDGTPRYFCVETDADMPVRHALAMACTVPLMIQYRKYQNIAYYDGIVADMNLLDYFDTRGITGVLGLTYISNQQVGAQSGIELVLFGILARASRRRSPDRRIVVINVPMCMPGLDGFANQDSSNAKMCQIGFYAMHQHLTNLHNDCHD